MPEAIGNKAQGLLDLESAGMQVPSFLVFGASDPIAEVEKKVIASFSPNRLLSVRSSSSLEDSSEKSFAGAFHTEVGIQPNELTKAWESVRASLPYPEKDGIIVQEMVEGEFSGVVFVDPEHGRALLSYLPGLCKAVVEGYDAYQVRFSEGDMVTEDHEGDRTTLIIKDGALQEVSSSAQMTSEQFLTVFNEGMHYAQSRGEALDMEWTMRAGQVFWLQARAITADPWGHERVQIYDSANVGESFGGIVSPLTLSFAQRLYGQVYRDLLSHSGVSDRVLQRHRNVFDTLVNGAYGRMYYRMDNWYRFMRMLPGYARNKRNLEDMLMLRKDDLDDLSIRPSWWLRLTYYPRAVWKLIRFGSTMRRFESEVKAELARGAELQFDKMNGEEVIVEIQRLFNGVLRKWYLTVENDTVVMTLLSALTKKGERDAEDELYAFHSVSTDQVEALAALSRSLHADPAIQEALSAEDEQAWQDALRKNSQAQQAYEAYLRSYGGRFANELKLETRDVTDDFTSFARLLRHFKNHRVNKRTSDTVKHPWLVRVFHRFASRREVFRLYRANMFGLMRKLVLRLAALWQERGQIAEQEDIFMLDWEDLLNERDPSDLQHKVQDRKQEWNYYKTVTPPSDFRVVDGRWPELTSEVEQLGGLRGIAASKGIASGEAEVIKQFKVPSKEKVGILVTERTDPGWTALMAISKGLVVEHGGMLSHASIVARELGLPAVIGVKDACQRIPHGSELTVDGTQGLVTINETTAHATD